MGVAVMSMAVVQNIYQYCVIHFLFGLGSGAWDSGNSMWLIEMWGEQVPALLHLQQMMYGIGTIISPLVISPFLVGDLSNKTDTTTVNTTGAPDLTTILSIINTTISQSNNNTSDDDINYSVDRRANLRVPFIVSGFLTFPGNYKLFVK